MIIQCRRSPAGKASPFTVTGTARCWSPILFSSLSSDEPPRCAALPPNRSGQIKPLSAFKTSARFENEASFVIVIFPVEPFYLFPSQLEELPFDESDLRRRGAMKRISVNSRPMPRERLRQALPDRAALETLGDLKEGICLISRDLGFRQTEQGSRRYEKAQQDTGRAGLKKCATDLPASAALKPSTEMAFGHSLSKEANRPIRLAALPPADAYKDDAEFGRRLLSPTLHIPESSVFIDVAFEKCSVSVISVFLRRSPSERCPGSLSREA